MIGGAGDDTIQAAAATTLLGGFHSRGEATAFDGDDNIYGDAGNDAIACSGATTRSTAATTSTRCTFAEVTADLTLDLAAGRTTYVEKQRTTDDAGE